MTALRRGARLGLAVLGAGTWLIAAPAAAQTATGAFAERPGDALSRNLRSLASNPKSVTALMGAGRAALDLGDAQAALTFFARAEEQLPRDGRIKMWLGSALVQLQQPHAALKFFRDASDLGVAEAEIAGDRGLAHDLAGNPRQAQRDYRLALQRARNDGIARRLALSLAISGERDPALQLLEGQLLVRDRAAERTRALVLALTGDTAGAARAVEAGMPGPQANAMTPFLARLPTLSPSQRALAVHLGVFPRDGRTAPATSYASNAHAAPGAVTEAGRPDAAQGSLARRLKVPEPVSAAPRRRPGSDQAATASAPRSAAARPERGRASPRIDSWALARGVLPTPTRRAEPPPGPAAAKASESGPDEAGTRTTKVSEPQPERASDMSAPPPGPRAEPVATGLGGAEPPPPPSAALQPADSAAGEAAPETTAPRTAPAEVPAPAASAASPPPAVEAAPAGSRLADISAALAGIDEPASTPARASARPKAAKPPAAQRAAAASAKKPKPKPPAEPARVWVQVAGGANRGALPREYARLKAKAPKLLGARTPWTAPNNASNRLLVGPFAGAREAQAFVNQLKAQSLSGFAWTSAAGQKVEKLPAK